MQYNIFLYQDRSDWVPIPINTPNETEPQPEQIKRYDSYVTPGGGAYTNHNLETIYYQKPINPSYKEDVPVYIPTDGVANNPIYTSMVYISVCFRKCVNF